MWGKTRFSNIGENKKACSTFDSLFVCYKIYQGRSVLKTSGHALLHGQQKILNFHFQGEIRQSSWPVFEIY